MTAYRRVVPLLGLILLVGCSRPDYIEIKPPNVVLRQKVDSVWLQAHAKNHAGTRFERAPIAWSVRDPAVVSVDAKGRLTPLKSGRTEVVARTGDVEASVPVAVLFAERIVVDPTALTLTEGGEPVEIRVKTFDFEGRELRDRSPAFRPADKEVVSMGQNAAFPMNAGKTQVEVQVDEQRQVIEVVVEPGKGKVAKK